MSALGETFRSARESQGFTLTDVADRIHIRSVYLAAIEAEDWQAIGPAVYIRGFLRTYSRFLGLDGDVAVASFNGGTVPVVLASPRGEPSRSGLPRGDGGKSGPSTWVLVGAIIAVVLAILAGYEYMEFRRGDVTRARAAAVAVAPIAPPPADRLTRVVLPSALRAAPGLHEPGKNLARSSAFAVRLEDNSWLRVVVDGKTVMEGLFKAGTSRGFSGRSVTVRAGNAGGVDLVLAGKDLGKMGGLGDVAERSFQL